jgi:hypothetical protein
VYYTAQKSIFPEPDNLSLTSSQTSNEKSVKTRSGGVLRRYTAMETYSTGESAMSRPSAILMLFGLFVAIAVQKEWRRHPADAGVPLPCRHTAQQMIDLSTPIYLSIQSRHNDIYACAEPNKIHKPGRQDQILWVVVYADEAGNPLLRITRDDATGMVQSISNIHLRYDAPLNASTPLLPSACVVTRAREWMVTLGFRENWQLAGQPQRTRLWHVRLCAGGRQAFLSLDPQQGYPVSLDITSGVR